MFEDNSWYGHRKILTDFCRLEDRPVYASIQHGWLHTSSIDNLNNLKITKIPGALHLCWNKKIENLYKKNNLYNVVSIGAPFLYLNHDFKIINEKGTIFFPPHSDKDNGWNVDINNELLLEYIIKNYPKPYTVCLFYSDITNSLINFYKKKNIQIVCCGERNNINFLINFKKFIHDKEFIIVNDFSSAYLYSLYLKKKTKIVTHFIKDNKKLFLKKTWRDGDTKEIGDEKIKIIMNEYNVFFDEKISFEKKREFALAELGYENKKKSDDLKKLLGLKNPLKIYGSKIFSQIKKIIENHH